MRTLLVTSQVTFVPQNYQAALAGALAGATPYIWGLLILKNFDTSLLKTAAGLYLLGAPRIASTLLRNVAELPLSRREKLFESHAKSVHFADCANDKKVIELVRDNGIDLIVNMRTRSIYKKAVLKAPRLGCVNVHHGLLPDYRGTMCDLMALADGRPAGFSIHAMTEKLDDGDIYHSEVVSDGTEKNYVSYLARTGVAEGRAIASLINTVANGGLPQGRPNTSANARYTKTPRSRAEVIALKERNMIL